MTRMSWVLELVLVALFLALAGFPQPAAQAADTTPPTGTIVINNNRSATNTPNVTLALTWQDWDGPVVGGSGVVRMRFSNDGATWSAWEPLAVTRPYTLPSGDGHKTVRVQYLDKANNRSLTYSDYIRLDTTPPTGSIVINGGAATTFSRSVTLGLTWDDGAGSQVSRMRFSDNGSTWTAWETPKAARAHTLPAGLGYHTVRVQYLDGAGNYSTVYNDYIKLVPPTMEMVPVAAGTFTMGRTASGDDATYGTTEENPQHQVTLSAYQIGKYPVTNKEYCGVLNWALAQGYLRTSTNATWAGEGYVYAGGNLQVILAYPDTYCNIQYAGGVFSSKTRQGLPEMTNYSMDMHPVQDVTWYGAVAFCNWLSQMQGLTPCYNMDAATWPLAVAPPTASGYRLPTEAEWERAAAWDGTKHWIYGFMSDALGAAANRANEYTGTAYVNPLGLTGFPYTSPVGWFNGVNVSPNGGVTALDSPSPVGAYDMSGNVLEWCGDFYEAYGADALTDPTGSLGGTNRVGRGGSWDVNFKYCRSAYRYNFIPTGTSSSLGFRLSRS